MPQSTNTQPVGFGERLVAAGQVRGRLCVGIDPHPYLLQQWGLEDTVDGLRRFSEACVEAFADTAALVKPQVAFYERFGSQGFAVLEDTLQYLREAGCLTVADAKRGDIGSTMAGYADAWLGESSPLRADAVTVSPYLGVAALQPVFDLAAKTGRGVFVLAATSNPEAVQLQNFRDDSHTWRSTWSILVQLLIASMRSLPHRMTVPTSTQWAILAWWWALPWTRHRICPSSTGQCFCLAWVRRVRRLPMLQRLRRRHPSWAFRMSRVPS